MHIPDGFISPKVYLPAWGVVSGLWAYSLSRVKKHLYEETLPLLSALTAFSFILMMVVVPLPGGTTIHGLGIGPLTVLFGPGISFLSISLVLLIQALLFGIGGITSLPINAFAIGFVGSYSLYFFHKLFGKEKKMGIFFSCLFATLLASMMIALILGIQPLIAKDAHGKPLFFPFGLPITLPALMIPHIFVGMGEGILTLMVLSIKEKYERKD